VPFFTLKYTNYSKSGLGFQTRKIDLSDNWFYRFWNSEKRGTKVNPGHRGVQFGTGARNRWHHWVAYSFRSRSRLRQPESHAV